VYQKVFGNLQIRCKKDISDKIKLKFTRFHSKEILYTNAVLGKKIDFVEEPLVLIIFVRSFMLYKYGAGKSKFRSFDDLSLCDILFKEISWYIFF
jgi:hypothetical protein